MKCFKGRKAALSFFCTGIILYSHSGWTTLIESSQPDLIEASNSQPLTIKSQEDIFHALFQAQSLLQAGQFKSVVNITRKILEQDSKNVKALSLRAAAYYVLGKHKDYQDDLKQLKRLAPDSPERYQALARAFIAVKNSPQAEAVYLEGLANSSQKSALRMGLARLYLKQGKTEQAARLYQKNLQQKGLSDKDFLNSSFALCRIELNNKAYAKVIQRALLITRKYPFLPQGYKILASAYKQQGKPEKSLKVYQSLLQANPDIPTPYIELAILYSEQFNNHKRALEYARQAVHKFPGNASSYDVLGWIYFRAGDYASATQYFNKAIQLSPDNPDFLYHSGLALRKTGNTRQATAAFEQALKLTDKNKAAKLAKELQQQINRQ